MRIGESETYYNQSVKARLTSTPEGYKYEVATWTGRVLESDNWGHDEREALIKWKALIKKYVDQQKQKEVKK